MKTTLALLVATALCAGCGRGTISGPPEIRSDPQAPRLLISSFGNEPRILTNAQLIRVGSYYDISQFDSVRVSFSAVRLSTETPFDEVLIKIGPATIFRDTVRAPQENLSVSAGVAEISKPVSCAFTFLTPDPRTSLEVSDLRVVCWMNR